MCFTLHKEHVKKLTLIVISKNTTTYVMPSTSIEPATLRSLARRSKQLSYAAAKVFSRIQQQYAQ